MNAVEIEEAVSALVAEPFDAAEFPFQFITAFGAKKTTVDRLRRGETNQSDVGGVLWRNYIHIAVAPTGAAGATLAALRSSHKTATQKAKFILATDGESVEAEDLASEEVVACAYADLPRSFATFLPLAGISAVKEIKNNPIDVKATGRLNKLYVTLLTDNPDWASEERRHALNQFMARLIFCYFAEDTGIFNGEGLFTATVAKMSQAGHGSGDEQWGNTHEVLEHLFLAMETPVKHDGNFDDRYRRAAGIRPYADVFPYVNGGLFSDGGECPRFSRTARAYLLSAGELDWKEINPDIFGSMIQAVADDDERGELGMHYTSVPNILKVLNPLFLDDLREQLVAAGDSRPRLRNLRKRLANIRVFDPACGSGNFLVIAYKQMRGVEAAIVKRLGGEASLKLDERRSVIPLSNFYGIEIKGFAAEIARLALLIAEFQADCLYLSQQEARAMVLPLHKTGQIRVGNALREDWLEVCPPVRPTIGAELDLSVATGRSALENNGPASVDAETYVCGNPPYYGSRLQGADHKQDLKQICAHLITKWKSLDYVCGWFLKASAYLRRVTGAFSFVSTSSLCEGLQVPVLWPYVLGDRLEIFFAHKPFLWANLAASNAGVAVVIVGVNEIGSLRNKAIFDRGERRNVSQINAYLLAGADIFVNSASAAPSERGAMAMGSMPRDGGNLIFSAQEARDLEIKEPTTARWMRTYLGADELINGNYRRCLWIPDEDAAAAAKISEISARLNAVRKMRADSTLQSTVEFSKRPHRFVYLAGEARSRLIAVAGVSSEHRPYIPADLLPAGAVASNALFALYDEPVWNLALIVSRLHLVWIATVCGKLETRMRYSNTLGWNTFPVPKLTEQDKADLTRTAENILLAREAHFPATIADLYDPEAMPDDLRRAHDDNDEVLERIYIGRRFRNDTERLEKLFDLYTRMTAEAPKARKGKQAA